MTRIRFPKDLELNARVLRLEQEYKTRYGLREIPLNENLIGKMILNRRRTLRERQQCWYPEVPDQDHIHLFRTKDGELVFTSQPYFVGDVEEIRRDAEAFAAQHGLVVRVSIEESWHYPGSTVLVEYRRPQALKEKE